MSVSMVIGAAIFLVTYGLIASERIHRTIAALGGGLAMVLLGILTQPTSGCATWFDHPD